MQSLLIKDTTRAQREEIVRRALSVCGDGCDGCNGCGNTGGGRVDSIYQPYIDGEKELAEINALRQRVRQYIKYGWGAAANHKGGRAVWQVENFPILLLDYEVCEDCEQREHELLAAFKRENGVYPLANWRG